MPDLNATSNAFGLPCSPTPYSELPTIPVRRVAGLTRESFAATLSGAGRPVIVTDIVRTWAASGRWNFEFFADAYGDRDVLARPDLTSLQQARLVKLREFILYCHAPALSKLGKDVNRTPFYVSFPLGHNYPELFSDFSCPPFLDNCYEELSGELLRWYRNLFAWLYIGPAGTVTPLHVDHFMTHTFSAQIAGVKKYLFFSPHILHRLPGISASTCSDVYLGREADPGTPFAAYEATVQPGEMIIFPAGWGHYVTALSPSISLSVNFVNYSNFLSHLMMISRKLPQWSRAIHTADFREANECVWSSRDFACLDRPIG